VGAILSTARSPDSVRSGAALPDLDNSGVEAKPLTYLDIAKCALCDMPASNRNSATRRATVELRLRVALGSTALTVAAVILDAPLARAATNSDVSTMTPRGHGTSCVRCLGHQGMQKRNLLVDIPSARAALPVVNATLKRVRRSVEESNIVLSSSLDVSVGM